MVYTDFNMCDIHMITSKKTPKFSDSVSILDGDKLKKEIAYCFTERKHYNIQMIVVCQKSAEIISTARMCSETIYITAYNRADLFHNFSKIDKCKHKFHKTVSELKSNYYNYTAGITLEFHYD